MTAPSNTIEFPNSPGIPITITRGGVDFVTGDTLSDQWVTLSWDEPYTEIDTDPETGETTTTQRTRTVHRSFVGPT